MGYHLLLQSMGLPFKSEESRKLNIEIHKFIKDEALIASKELAYIYGEPEWCRGTQRRHTHLLAIAPTRTNAVISGAFSQGVEPIDRNFFIAKQHTGTYVRKNPILVKLLQEKNKDNPEVWDKIAKDEGSVKNLPFLTPKEKEIFLTFREIDQEEIIRQACVRQPYICQAQSINLAVNPYITAQELLELHLKAWKNGLKSLYYLRSTSLQNKQLKEKDSVLIITKEGCPWCEKAIDLVKSYPNNFKLEIMDRNDVKDWGAFKGCEDFKTFPRIFMNETFIGGFSELTKIISVPYQQEEEEDCLACQG